MTDLLPGLPEPLSCDQNTVEGVRWAGRVSREFADRAGDSPLGAIRHEAYVTLSAHLMAEADRLEAVVIAARPPSLDDVGCTETEAPDAEVRTA